MTATLAIANDNLDGVLCSCGEPIKHHRCPSSQGYAPRQPKTASCRACGEKAHQNLEKTTVALECLWRQWSRATGQTIAKNNRLVLPAVTAINIARMQSWLAGSITYATDGSVAPPVATMTANGGYQEPDTASVLKRMQARADTAAPQPEDAPPTPASVDSGAADDDQDAKQHPVGCDDGCEADAIPLAEQPLDLLPGCGIPAFTSENIARVEASVEAPVARLDARGPLPSAPDTATDDYSDLF